MMRIKRGSLYNLWNVSLFYVFAVLYTQILEVFLPFSFTKIYVLFFLIAITVGILRKKINASIYVYFVLIWGIVFIIAYCIKLDSVFKYVYSGVICLIYSYLSNDNSKSVKESLNMKTINKLMFGYLLLSILLYLSKSQVVFQGSQFKGALPHTNMLGAVLFSLFIMIFWDNSLLASINKVLLTGLGLALMSRTYILMLLALWLLLIVTCNLKTLSLFTKIVFGTALLVLFGGVLFDLLIDIVPGFNRFATFGFGANGRQVLEAAYIDVYKKADVVDLLFAIPLVKRYLSNIAVDFSHSFTENSHIGMFLLFGLLGGVSYVVSLVRMFKTRNGTENVIILILVLVSFCTQDTIFSVQTGVLLFFALAICNETLLSNNKNKKPVYYYEFLN